MVVKFEEVNRALSPAQIFTCDINKMLQCSCDSFKVNPCGLESDCLNRSMLVECHPDLCKAKNLCQNQKFQKAGEFVIEYVGEIITHEEYGRRYREKGESSNFYFLYVDSRRMIDAGPMGNYSRFINHSCGPNCEMIKWSVNGDARIGIFALREIHAGEELTFNYQSGTYIKYEFEQKCLCSSVNCRGFIGGKNKSSQKKNTKKSIKEGKKALKRRNAKERLKIYVPDNVETKRMSCLNGCADLLIQSNGTISERPTRNSRKIKLCHDPLPEVCDITPTYAQATKTFNYPNRSKYYNHNLLRLGNIETRNLCKSDAKYSPTMPTVSTSSSTQAQFLPSAPSKTNHTN
ncbi:histone-lysine N-methyltransferase, H3 lysine-36 specific [Trichonephila clavipes]|nr:histone-lysine N-methyltransferase, H3 lysine-36 specific [Trichonephila clavipes]